MQDVQSVADLASALIEAKRELEYAQEDLVDAVYKAAEADKLYRIAKAKAFTSAVIEIGGRDSVGARTYVAEAETAEEKYAAKLSEDLRVAALERVRSCRSILTAVQTLSNAWREEVAFARSGPDA